MSTGGALTTEKFVKQLNLNNSTRVLDVGCGIGGSAFLIARTYGSRVHGIDLSSNMISMAVKYQSEMEDSVRKAVSLVGNWAFSVIRPNQCFLHCIIFR